MWALVPILLVLTLPQLAWSDSVSIYPPYSSTTTPVATNYATVTFVLTITTNTSQIYQNTPINIKLPDSWAFRFSYVTINYQSGFSIASGSTSENITTSGKTCQFKFPGGNRDSGTQFTFSLYPVTVPSFYPRPKADYFYIHADLFIFDITNPNSPVSGPWNATFMYSLAAQAKETGYASNATFSSTLAGTTTSITFRYAKPSYVTDSIQSGSSFVFKVPKAGFSSNSYSYISPVEETFVGNTKSPNSLYFNYSTTSEDGTYYIYTMYNNVSISGTPFVFRVSNLTTASFGVDNTGTFVTEVFDNNGYFLYAEMAGSTITPSCNAGLKCIRIYPSSASTSSIVGAVVVILLGAVMALL